MQASATNLQFRLTVASVAVRLAESRIHTGGYTRFDRDIHAESEVTDLVTCDGRTLAFVSAAPQNFRTLFSSTVMFVDVDVSGEKRIDMLQILHQFVSINPEYGFRVYMTTKGLRYICTSALADPCSEDTQSIFRSLETDPNYAALCLDQALFAARIEPKPERCTVRHQNYAANQFLWAEGASLVHPDCRMVVAFHDWQSQSHSGKPLG